MSIKMALKHITSSLLGVAVALTVSSASVDEDLVSASNNFFAEEGVFLKESGRLYGNTQEIDKTLIGLEKTLMIPHEANNALQSLDKSMTTVELGLTALEMVPQTRVQAKQFKTNLQLAHKPVKQMADTTYKIDKAIFPLYQTVEKTENAVVKLLDMEDSFRMAGIKYGGLIGKMVNCEHGEWSIKAINSSLPIYQDIDSKLKLVNDKYDDVKKIPYQSIGLISEQIKEIVEFAEFATQLDAQLAPLSDYLNQLRVVLDRRVGMTEASYPCGIKMCTQSIPYPCTKTCKKDCYLKSCSYPCYKTCHRDQEYPCGPKMCSVGISISVADALKGADEIEKIIESSISSVAFKALKEAGMGEIISELQSQAKNLVNPILSKINLNMNLNIPNPNINLDIASFDVLKVQIDGFSNELNSFSYLVDLNGGLKHQLDMLTSITKRMDNMLQTKFPNCKSDDEEVIPDVPNVPKPRPYIPSCKQITVTLPSGKKLIINKPCLPRPSGKQLISPVQ